MRSFPCNAATDAAFLVYFRLHELYHPTSLAALSSHAQSHVASFERDLENGSLSSTDFDAPAGIPAPSASVHLDGLVLRVAASASSSSPRVLIVGGIPPTLRRHDLESMLKRALVTDADIIDMTDADPARGFRRSCRVALSASEQRDAEQLCRRVSQEITAPVQVSIVAAWQPTAFVPCSLAASEPRKRADLTNVLRVVARLDALRGVSCPLPAVSAADVASVGAAELSRQLDLRLLYLRRVHLFDYYTATQFRSAASLASRAGDVLLRPRGDAPEHAAALLPAGAWSSQLDTRVAALLADPLSAAEVAALGGKDADAEAERVLRGLTHTLDDARHRCSLCDKLFRGAEFVHKHIRVKHEEKVAAAVKEVEYLNGFLADKNRPSVIVVQQQQQQQQQQQVRPREERPRDDRPRDDRHDRQDRQDRHDRQDRPAYERSREHERPPRHEGHRGEEYRPALVSYANVLPPREVGDTGVMDYETEGIAV